MTEEEEKKLKPGDLVLAYVELVREYPGANGHWLGKTCTDRIDLCPDDIHSVHERARRRFRKGDIVIIDNKTLSFVAKDECSNYVEISPTTGSSSWRLYYDKFSLAQLVCPVDERHDRKENEND